MLVKRDNCVRLPQLTQLLRSFTVQYLNFKEHSAPYHCTQYLGVGFINMFLMVS